MFADYLEASSRKMAKGMRAVESLSYVLIASNTFR